MKIVTCISDRQHPDYTRYLRASCAHHGLELVTLVFPGGWPTHRIKDFMLRRFLRTLAADEVVLFSDGYDAVLTSPAADILDRYRSFATPVVFSAEKNCWPDPSIADRFPRQDAASRFLNSGGFVGRAGVLLELLERYLHSSNRGGRVGKGRAPGGRVPELHAFPWSNQWFWSLVFLENQDLISLDHESRFFLELAPELATLEANRAAFAESLERSALYRSEHRRVTRSCAFDESGVWHRPTGSRPCHLHFNGPVAKRMARNGVFDAVMPWLARSRFDSLLAPDDRPRQSRHEAER